MSGPATWLILIDSEKEVTQAAIVEAVGRVEGVTVGATAFGTTAVYNGCTVGISYSEDPAIREESKKIAETFGKAHRDRARIARAWRRFEITFHWDHAQVLRDVLPSIESELSALVEEDGGRTFAFNPQTEEFF